MIRGGRRHGTWGDDNNASDRVGADEQGQSDTSNNPAVEKIEQFAADLRAKKDDIVENVRAQGEAIAEGLKAKQEKLADEVLRDRSPEVFGGLDGHHSYDSATAVSLRVAVLRLSFLKMGLPNPFRETQFSGANAEREIFIFPVQLTTCRIGNLTRLIHTLAICVTIQIAVPYLQTCREPETPLIVWPHCRSR